MDTLGRYRTDKELNKAKTTNRRNSSPATSVAAVSSHTNLTLVLDRPVKTAVKSKITTSVTVSQLDNKLHAGLWLGNRMFNDALFSLMRRNLSPFAMSSSPLYVFSPIQTSLNNVSSEDSSRGATGAHTHTHIWKTWTMVFVELITKLQQLPTQCPISSRITLYGGHVLRRVKTSLFALCRLNHRLSVVSRDRNFI